MGKAAEAFSESSKPRRHNLWKRIGLSTVMAIAVAAPAVQAQTAYSAPQQPANSFSQNYAPAPTVPQDLQSYVNNPNDAAEIRALKNEFVKTDLGVGVMRFAKEHGIRFVLDDSLRARQSKAEYEPSDGTIRIQPGQKLEALVIYTAHEIRHGWQDKVLGAFEKERGVLTPWQHFTLRRFMEADAEAFASYFEADRLQNGVHMGPGFAEAMPASNIALQLRGELTWSRDGLTFGEYRDLAFKPALANLRNYNAKHLALVENMTQALGDKIQAAGNDPRKLAELNAEVSAAPTDAQFAAYLRHFGGVSFNPQAQTSMQSKAVTDNMLLNDYPQLEVNPRVRQNFDATVGSTIQKMTDLQNGYIRQLQDLKTGHKPSGFKPGA